MCVQIIYILRKNVFSVEPKENPQKNHIYRNNNIELLSKHSFVNNVNTDVFGHKFYIIFSTHV
jgi:hypothetical protein